MNPEDYNKVLRELHKQKEKEMPYCKNMIDVNQVGSILKQYISYNLSIFDDMTDLCRNIEDLDKKEISDRLHKVLCLIESDSLPVFWRAEDLNNDSNL
jgi:hypothetical protein